MKELPETDKYRPEYIDRFRTLAKSVAACQQPEGYWTRSMLDPLHAPGPETSGTAFFTYGLQWGINNGFLDAAEYQPVVEKHGNISQQLLCSLMARLVMCNRLVRKQYPVRS